MLGLDFKRGDIGEIARDFLRRRERKEAPVIVFGGKRTFAARLLHQFEIDRSRRIVVANCVGKAGDAKPVGREDFRLFLDLDCQPFPVVLPIRIDHGLGRARHILLF